MPQPIGSVLVTPTSDGLNAVATARIHHEAAPWCAICLLRSSASFDHRLVSLLEPFPGAFAIASLPPSGMISPSAVVHAVSTRRPSADQLAGYVARRLGRARLVEPLAECFQVAEDGVHTRLRARSRLSRQLRSCRPFTAVDWVSLGRVTLLLATRPRSTSFNLQQVAGNGGIDPRTLQRYVRKYLRWGMCDALRIVTWEGLLELCLRKFGYVTVTGRGDACLAGPLRAAPAPSCQSWPDERRMDAHVG